MADLSSSFHAEAATAALAKVNDNFEGQEAAGFYDNVDSHALTGAAALHLRALLNHTDATVAKLQHDVDKARKSVIAHMHEKLGLEDKLAATRSLADELDERLADASSRYDVDTTALKDEHAKQADIAAREFDRKYDEAWDVVRALEVQLNAAQARIRALEAEEVASDDASSVSSGHPTARACFTSHDGVIMDIELKGCNDASVGKIVSVCAVLRRAVMSSYIEMCYVAADDVDPGAPKVRFYQHVDVCSTFRDLLKKIVEFRELVCYNRCYAPHLVDKFTGNTFGDAHLDQTAAMHLLHGSSVVGSIHIACTMHLDDIEWGDIN